MTETPADDGAITVADLSVGFSHPERREILHDVNVRIEHGQSAALVGPSGCGKTSLLRCLVGLLTPSAGSILLGGTDPYQISTSERRRLLATTIGYIPQRPSLIRHANAIDNVLIGGIGGTRQSRRDRRERALEIMGELDIAALRRSYPTELSGGQMQRVCVARALMASPLFVLADEPTSSVSRLTAEQVLNCIVTHASTVVVATHDPHVHERMSLRLEVNQWQV